MADKLACVVVVVVVVCASVVRGAMSTSRALKMDERAHGAKNPAFRERSGEKAAASRTLSQRSLSGQSRARRPLILYTYPRFGTVVEAARYVVHVARFCASIVTEVNVFVELSLDALHRKEAHG